MADLKRKGQIAKDKVVGEIREKIGKMTDNEKLELKGKLQSAKAELREKKDEFQEDIAEKVNEFIDKGKKDKE